MFFRPLSKRETTKIRCSIFITYLFLNINLISRDQIQIFVAPFTGFNNKGSIFEKSSWPRWNLSLTKTIS